MPIGSMSMVTNGAMAKGFPPGPNHDGRGGILEEQVRV